MNAARIEFIKGEGRRYRSVIERPDGVVVEFDGGAYNRVSGDVGELPHDLAHLVVEDELRVREGVWGVARALCDGGAAPDPAAMRRAVGERWWTDTITRESLGRASERLRGAAESWARLRTGESLEAAWRLVPARGAYSAPTAFAISW